jgi:hypothetical protein
MPTIDLKDSESQNSEVYNLKVTIGALKFVGRTILGAQRRRIKNLRMNTLPILRWRRCHAVTEVGK